MQKSFASVGILAAALLVVGSPAATAQPAGQPAGGVVDLGPAGDLLPGSATGSLPGYATGPLGSSAYTLCNAGSAAGLAGVAVPGVLDTACYVLPSLGEAADNVFEGNIDGAVTAMIGSAPYVGSALKRVVPSESAADAIDGALADAGIDPTTLDPQLPEPALPFDVVAPEYPWPEIPGS